MVTQRDIKGCLFLVLLIFMVTGCSGVGTTPDPAGMSSCSSCHNNLPLLKQISDPIDPANPTPG